MSIARESRNDGVLRRGVLSSIRFVKRIVIEPMVRWNRRRTTIQVLSSLNDAMLADIGVSRHEIAQLAHGRMPRRGAVSALSVVDPARRSPEPAPEMRRAA